jgi:hypothetical protein
VGFKIWWAIRILALLVILSFIGVLAGIQFALWTLGISCLMMLLVWFAYQFIGLTKE